MVDQAVSHAANYMEHDGLSKDGEFKTQNMRRWIIGHEYVAPMKPCISSWNILIVTSLQGTGRLLSRAY
jgi:hypothetical protein